MNFVRKTGIMRCGNYAGMADKFLKDFYKSVGAKTWEQKFNALELKLGDGPGSFSHNPTWEQKTGMLEYIILENERLIEIQ